MVSSRDAIPGGKSNSKQGADSVSFLATLRWSEQYRDALLNIPPCTGLFGQQ